MVNGVRGVVSGLGGMSHHFRTTRGATPELNVFEEGWEKGFAHLNTVADGHFEERVLLTDRTGLSVGFEDSNQNGGCDEVTNFGRDKIVSDVLKN